jgi:glyoxylase-like metal-dependent hydrolase (beta-lactamase superfamily II)
MRCLLVESKDRRMLIDTGMGSKQDAKFFGHYQPTGDSLISNLRTHGCEPEQVTDVFLTHLHFDHGGGALVRGANGTIQPAFPNAVYWSNRRHWVTATQPNERERASFLKENILPLQETNLRFVDEAGSEPIFPGLSIYYVDGHTEAMMLPRLEWSGRSILFCADLFPSSAHIPLPWIMAYDMRPLVTLEEKKKILEQAVAGDWVLFFEHDPKVECATVQQTERGLRLKETFPLVELGL